MTQDLQATGTVIWAKRTDLEQTEDSACISWTLELLYGKTTWFK